MFKGLNFINGKFVEFNSAYFEAFNPSSEEVYGQFPLSCQKDVVEAVTLARKAQLNWSKTSRIYRADLFDNLAQLLKRDHFSLRNAIATETGKSLNEAHAEVIEMLHLCQSVAGMGRQSYGEIFASELSTKDAYVIRKPRGVVAVISPWNFPLLGSFWSSSPALLEGNTVVHKPSELTPMVAQLVASLYCEAGFPCGVYNLVHGDGTTGSFLVKSDIDVILFTGSFEVGQEIKKHCAETHSKTYSVECGSKSAMIVFEDGDIDLGVEASVASAFKLSGQRCVSSGRILVQESVYDRFITKFLEKVLKLTLGNPFDNPSPSIGPLISAEQKLRVNNYKSIITEDGDVKVVYDTSSCPNVGYFSSPMVFLCEWGNKRFLKEEIFGPVVGLIPFKDLDEAINIYNDTDFGLSLGVITDDYRKHREIVQRCTTGMLYINGSSIGAESHLPFSSWKKSGYGVSAAGTWKAVTHTMAITTNYEKGKLQFAQGMKS